MMVELRLKKKSKEKTILHHNNDNDNDKDNDNDDNNDNNEDTSIKRKQFFFKLFGYMSACSLLPEKNRYYLKKTNRQVGFPSLISEMITHIDIYCNEKTQEPTYKCPNKKGQQRYTYNW